MAKGDVFPSERRRLTDAETGATVWQLTDSPAHDYHLYFTSTSFAPDGSSLVFGSERTGDSQLFRMDLSDGRITQLTSGDSIRAQGAALSRDGLCLHFFAGPRLQILDIDTLVERTLYEVPSRFSGGTITVTDDGKTVAFVEVERVQLKTQTGRIYSGMEEMFRRRPHCRIMTVGTDSGSARTVHADDVWISHVLISPTDPELVLFCHEGGLLVSQRMWTVRAGRAPAPLRVQQPGEFVVHEYWTRDGKRVGYHGLHGDPPKPMFGFIKPDNTDCTEFAAPDRVGHYQTNSDDSHQVTDHGTHIHLVTIDADEPIAHYEKVCRHDTSWSRQCGHPHPIFSPDDRSILFSSDPDGITDVYLAEIPKKLPAKD